MQVALVAAGFRVVDWDEPADVRVVNTCTVTARSDRTCRHEIHAAKRRDPECLLAVTGCFAQVAPESVAAIPGVDLVLGNPDKPALPEHLATALRGHGAGAGARARGGAQASETAVEVSAYPTKPGLEAGSFAHFRGRSRAFLKVQTGCDSHCAYCIVPLARGPARSLPSDAVAEQAFLLASQGYREIVLTGIDLGSWGRDTGEGSLADLLARLLEDGARPPKAIGAGNGVTAPRLGRLRLSSVEPLELDARLLDVVHQAGERMARHFHLPLQSGSDAVLARMGRPYSGAQYLQAAASLVRRLPDAAVGADVIVGFPGETDAEFEETLLLVEASPLTYLHVFAYSDRPGTAAMAMRPKIPPGAIKERSERLRELAARKKAAFRDRLVGTEQRALVMDEHAEDGRLVGLTGNYMEVLVPEDAGLANSPVNSFVRVRLETPLPSGRWNATVLEREP